MILYTTILINGKTFFILKIKLIEDTCLWKYLQYIYHQKVIKYQNLKR